MSPNKQKKALSAKQQLINNTPKLIKLMEAKPMLWDTTDPNFYNLPERAEIWRDITRQMFSNFDEYDEEGQKQMILQIKTRWRHVRTAYVRHKKVPNLKKSGYVYDKEMAFYSSQGRSGYSWFNGHKGEKFSRKIPKVEHCESNDDEMTYRDLEHHKSMKKRRKERKSRIKSMKVDNSSPRNSVDEIFHEILIQESDASNADNEGFSYMYEYDDEHGEQLNGSNGSPNVAQGLKLGTYHPMEENSAIVDEDAEEDEQNNQNIIHPMVQIPADEKEVHQETKPFKPSSRKKTTDMKSYRDLKTPDIDDDQCFFDSLKPALRDLSEDEKMDFRIEVMSILRDLKRR